MKIIIELDNTGAQEPEIKKESTAVSAVSEQQVINLASFVSASPIDAGPARIPDGYNNPSEGSSTSMQSMQGSMPSTITGAIDAGAAKFQEEVSQVSTPEMSPMGSYDQGSAYSAGAFVNMGTHHN